MARERYNREQKPNQDPDFNHARSCISGLTQSDCSDAVRYLIREAKKGNLDAAFSACQGSVAASKVPDCPEAVLAAYRRLSELAAAWNLGRPLPNFSNAVEVEALFYSAPRQHSLAAQKSAERKACGPALSGPPPAQAARDLGIALAHYRMEHRSADCQAVASCLAYDPEADARKGDLDAALSFCTGSFSIMDDSKGVRYRQIQFAAKPF